MSETTTSWLRSLKKILIGISMLAGLYLFAFQVSRLVVSSLFRGIESSRATGLSGIAPVAFHSFHALPAYQSADGLLQAGGINIVRALSLALEMPHFEATESRVREIVQQSGGFLEEFKIHRQSESSPWLEARLRLPVNSLDSALTTIRNLGSVRQETESSENTSAEKESLNTQRESKRAEVSRLNDIVHHRSGSLSDTVAADEKLSERRNELNDLDKRWKKLESRVEYALVELQIAEQYQAHLDWRTGIVLSDLRNSLIEGLDALLWSFGEVLSFLLRYGMLISVWAGILYWPSRIVLRRYRRSRPLASATSA
jgi:hypothetical protein